MTLAVDGKQKADRTMAPLDDDNWWSWWSWFGVGLEKGFPLSEGCYDLPESCFRVSGLTHTGDDGTLL